MARGYPSRKRVRKAYWRGVKSAKTGRGFNPYRNPTLKALFDRGFKNPGGASGVRPISALETPAARSPSRPAERRRAIPRRRI